MNIFTVVATATYKATCRILQKSYHQSESIYSPHAHTGTQSVSREQAALGLP